MLSELGSKMRGWFASLSLSKSDKEWEEEFEREINAQVDAVFKMTKEMGDCAEPDGISPDFNEDLFVQTMDNLTERIKKQRRKNRVSLPVFLVILVMSILLVRYSNPAMWIKEYK